MLLLWRFVAEALVLKRHQLSEVSWLIVAAAVGYFMIGVCSKTLRQQEFWEMQTWLPEKH